MNSLSFEGKQWRRVAKSEARAAYTAGSDVLLQCSLVPYLDGISEAQHVSQFTTWVLLPPHFDEMVERFKMSRWSSDRGYGAHYFVEAVPHTP